MLRLWHWFCKLFHRSEAPLEEQEGPPSSWGPFESVVSDEYWVPPQDPAVPVAHYEIAKAIERSLETLMQAAWIYDHEPADELEPLQDFLQTARRAVTGIRQQYEQLCFGGEPHYPHVVKRDCDFPVTIPFSGKWKLGDVTLDLQQGAEVDMDEDGKFYVDGELIE